MYYGFYGLQVPPQSGGSALPEARAEGVSQAGTACWAPPSVGPHRQASCLSHVCVPGQRSSLGFTWAVRSYNNAPRL